MRKTKHSYLTSVLSLDKATHVVNLWCVCEINDDVSNIVILHKVMFVSLARK